MDNSHFTKEDIEKYKDYMITSSKHHTPPYEWSEGIFQRFKPVSGKFLIGNNFFGNEMCVNNQTGRGYYANPCGYWESTNEQFNSGKVYKNIKMDGSLFPISNEMGNNNVMSNVMSPPNDRVVFGYARIGENFRSR